MKPFHLSTEYWNSLSDRDRELYFIISPLPQSNYIVDVGASRLEAHLASLDSDMKNAGGSLDLNPDFQRGHVWTDDHRSRYIEALFQGAAPNRIIFNCPGWVSGPFRADEGSDIPEFLFQCVDGLQRITAVRKFVAGEISIFGGLRFGDLEGTAFSVRRLNLRLSFHVFSFTRKADLLRFYIDLNRGGVIHSDEEIERVREMLRQTEAAGRI